MRTGLDRRTGEVLTGWAEAAQSIGVIVTTALGSLVLARDFGCNAPALLDRPLSPPAIMDHFVAIAEALRREEPGYRLRKIGVERAGADGVVVFALAGDFYPLGHLGDWTVVEQRALAAPFTIAALIGGGR